MGASSGYKQRSVVSQEPSGWRRRQAEKACSAPGPRPARHVVRGSSYRLGNSSDFTGYDNRNAGRGMVLADFTVLTIAPVGRPWKDGRLLAIVSDEVAGAIPKKGSSVSGCGSRCFHTNPKRQRGRSY